MTLREITMRQLTEALGVSDSAYIMRAQREGWRFRPGPNNGLKGCTPRLYDVSGLPDDIRERLEASPAEALNRSAPELLRRLEVSTAELVDYRDAMRADCSRGGEDPDPVDEAEISSLSVEIERNIAAIARARGLPFETGAES